MMMCRGTAVYTRSKSRLCCSQHSHGRYVCMALALQHCYVTWRLQAHVGDGLEVGVEDALEHELHPLHALDVAVLRPPERCKAKTGGMSSKTPRPAGSAVAASKAQEAGVGMQRDSRKLAVSITYSITPHDLRVRTTAI